MPDVYCPLHDATVRAAEIQDPNGLLEYTGSEDCPDGEECPEICYLGRLYRYRFASFRRNEPVPEGENPAELWTRLVYLAEVERVNRATDVVPPPE
jgi:hypothetical protein